MRQHLPAQSHLKHDRLCHLFIEHLPFATAILDRHLNYLLFSHRWLSDLGLEQHEIVGRSHAEVFPQDYKPLRAAYQRCLTEAIELFVEEPFQRTDGSMGWRKWKIQPWRDSIDQIDGIILAVEDITERRQAEEALAVNETRLKDTAANLPGVIFQFANRNDVWMVDYVSEGIWNLAGVTPEAMTEDLETFIRHIHPEDLESYYASVVGAVEQSIPWHYEGRLIKPSGEVRWWQGSSVPTKKQQGETIFCGVLLDITDRKQAEAALKHAWTELESRVEERTNQLQQTVARLQNEIQEREQVQVALRESEAELQAIIDNCSAVVYLKDIEGQYIRVNREFERLFNITKEQSKGKTDYDIFPKEIAAQFQQNDRQILARRKAILSEELVPHENGLHTYVSVKFPIFNAGGEPYALGGISADISDRKALEIELELQKARFDAFFAAANAGLVIFDNQLRYVNINEALAEMNGLSAREHIGKTLYEVIPHLAHILKPMFQEILDTGKSIVDYELIGETPKQPGVTRYWLASYYPLVDKDGKRFGIGGVVIEISDRKRVEEQLRKERDFNQKLIQTSPAFFTTIRADGTVMLMNDAMLKAVDYTIDAAIGKDYLSTFVPERDRATVADGFAKLSIGQIDIRETHILTKTGKELLVEWHGTPVYKEDGSFDYFFGVGIDITERKRAEQERDRFFNLSADMLCTAGFDGYFKRVNPAWTRTLGYTQEELFSQPFLNFIHPDDRKATLAEFNKIQDGAVSLTFENRYRCKDGSYKWLSWCSVPLVQEGLTYATARDITASREMAERLRLSEKRYQTLAEASPICVFYTDDRGYCTYANQRWSEIAGMSPVQAIGNGWLKALHPEDRDRVIAGWQAASQLRQQYKSECRFLRPDGTVVWLIAQASRIEDENGELIGYVGTLTDMTDRKQAEEALQERNAILRSILESTPDFIVVKDRQGRHVALNSNLASFLGKPVEDIIGKDDTELLPPNMARAIMAKDRQVIKLGISETYEEVVSNSETSSTFLTTKAPWRDTDGNILGIVAVTRDISDRKRTEEALRQSEEQVQAILDNSPAVIYLKDLQGRFLLINRTFEKLLKRDRQQVIGKTDADIVPPEVVAEFAKQDRAILATGRALHWEDVFPHEDGWHHYLTVKFPLRDSRGLPYAICGMSTDITDRKRAEEALQHSETQLREKAQQVEQTLRELQQTQAQLVQTEKMSGLGQLVAGVAHEINNPVNFIYGNLTHADEYMRDLLRLLELYQKHYPAPHPEIEDEAEAIDLEFLIEDLPNLLSSMKVGADRIQKIVVALRNFSRMDEAEVKAVNIHEGIDSTLMILHNRLKDKSDRAGIEVIKEYGNLPAVECYAGQLNQVFMNLLSNAIDALNERDGHRSLQDTKHSPSQITIRTHVLNAQYVRICIADNGPGMTEAVKRRLFEPFFTTKPVGKGTGLGLSISYQVVVEKHCGTLECFSEPGEGAEFVIDIPIKTNPKVAC